MTGREFESYPCSGYFLSWVAQSLASQRLCGSFLVSGPCASNPGEKPQSLKPGDSALPELRLFLVLVAQSLASQRLCGSFLVSGPCASNPGEKPQSLKPGDSALPVLRLF